MSQIPVEAHSEQHKESLSLLEKVVGESSKMLDDDAPSQLRNNCTRKSRAVVSGLCHSEQQNGCVTPEKSAAESEPVGETSNIKGGCTEVPNNNVDKLGLSLQDVSNGPKCEQMGPRPDDKSTSTGNVPYVVVALRSAAEGYCETQSNDKLGPSLQDVSDGPKCEQMGPRPDDTSKSTGNVPYIVVALRSAAEGYSEKQSRATRAASYKKCGTELKPAIINGSTNSRSSGRRHNKTPETKLNSEYKLRSSATGKDHTPSIQEKPVVPEPGSNMVNASSGRKRGRKKGQKNREINDEFSRMRVHLRYLMHRIRREQYMIDAYSSEGWRGQSLEKLRPEKELERAKSDINRSKLKIRALFQRLDAICAEGRFPETIFDSEGLIDSEDIFCAKCGHRDLSPNNDIILCDGACDRGFHQLCLDPPLLTEEIPPGDEGWFCPACDCKFDCVELLNDSMGTKLNINDSWENVFPEAEAKYGNALDNISGLPSDDSEDNDFDPNAADNGDNDDDDDDDDDEMEGGESTSDESDFSSASEDLGAIIHNNDDQYLGLPSDDSEDDDFDPNSVEAEDQPKDENSSSDFSSASENLHDVIENDEVSSKDEHVLSPCKLVQECDDAVLVSGRRKVDKLDYKKLYDETYGNATTDSSDDEEWNDAITPKNKKNGRKKTSFPSSEGEELKDRVSPKRRRYGPRNASAPTITHDIPVAVDGLSNVVNNKSPIGKSPLSPKVGASNKSQTPETSTGYKSKKKQPYVKLGAEVIQGLYASFEVNQYPDRSTKEKLAEELGVTPKKISKWFEYTRWIVNHSKPANGSTPKAVPRGRRKLAKSFDQKDNTTPEDVTSHEVDKAPLNTNKDAQLNSNTKPKRKLKSDVGQTSGKKPLRQSGRRKNSGKSL